jgi:YfiH family protein
VSTSLPLRAFPFDSGPVTAVVTTRHGGVSEGDYTSLNLGGHVGDHPAAVAENRRRLAAALGVDKLTVADQKHTARVAVVDERLAGRGHDGAADAAAALPATDAMITSLPGAALAILVADCAPVVLYDPARRAAGVAHSGRAGTVKGVIPATVKAMAATFGSVPHDLLVGIGPAIGAASYEIGAAEAAEVTAALGDAAAGLLTPSGRPRRALFDLTGAIRGQLRAAGVPQHSVYDLAIDTRASTADFFSDRAARPCGRFAAVAVLRPLRGHHVLAEPGVAGAERPDVGDPVAGHLGDPLRVADLAAADRDQVEVAAVEAAHELVDTARAGLPGLLAVQRGHHVDVEAYAADGDDRRVGERLRPARQAEIRAVPLGFPEPPGGHVEDVRSRRAQDGDQVRELAWLLDDPGVEVRLLPLGDAHGNDEAWPGRRAHRLGHLGDERRAVGDCLAAVAVGARVSP